MSKMRVSVIKSLDQFDWVFIVVAAAAIVIGVFHGLGSGPVEWGAMAGPLFTLASACILAVTLRIQMREYQKGLEMLKVSKQEKLLDLGCRAIEELSMNVYNHMSNEVNDPNWIENYAKEWVELFTPDSIARRMNEMISAAVLNRTLLNGYDEINALVLRMEWISRLIAFHDWDPSDKEYVNVILEPLRREVFNGLTPAFGEVETKVEEAASLPEVVSNKRLHKWMMDQSNLVDDLMKRLMNLRVHLPKGGLGAPRRVSPPYQTPSITSPPPPPAHQ
jgi:hypothetical protein